MNREGRAYGFREKWLEPIRSHVEKMSASTTLLVVAGLLIFLYVLRPILLPFVLAGIIAYIFTPLVDWASQRWRVKRWIPALLVVLCLMSVAAVVIFLGGPPLMQEARSVAGDLKGTISALAHKLIGNRSFHMFGGNINADTIAQDVVSGLHNWMGSSQILGIMILAFTAIFGFILSWVLLGYFLIDAHRIASGLLWLVPPSHRPFVSRVWERLNPVLHRYFVGIALVVVYASCAAYIGLGLFLGLQHAIVLALLTGFLEIIPLIGPAASAVLAGLVAVQESKSSWGIITYIFYAAALRISIDEFFGPIVLGRAGRVRPVLVMFCFLAGGLLFGMIGVVLAVPTALTVKAVLAELYGDVNAEAK